MSENLCPTCGEQFSLTHRASDCCRTGRPENPSVITGDEFARAAGVDMGTLARDIETEQTNLRSEPSAQSETITEEDLHTVMDNGATVRDWLGTAMTAARVAARHLDELRNGDVRSMSEGLTMAENRLRQASEEVATVREFLARF